MEQLQSHLFHENDQSDAKIDVHSFRPETTIGKGKNLSSYLNSQQIFAAVNFQQPNTFKQQTYNSEPNEDIRHKGLMLIRQNHYMFNPQIYESYRTQHKIEQIPGDNFKIIFYNKGRVEYHYQDCVQIQLPRIVTLTHFKNGDYKIVNHQMVYFWHQEDKILEKYSINV